MKKLFALLIALMLLVSLAACGDAEKDNDSDSESATEAVAADGSEASASTATEAEKTITVSTPFADLKVPASYEGKVENKVTSEDPYTVTFSVKDDGTELYSVVFNGKGDILLGTIVGKKENTVIYMNTRTLNSKDKNYELYLSYQDGSSVIVNNLKKDYEFVMNAVVKYEDQDSETFDIKTDTVTLKYPAKWKDKVKVDVTKDAVKFSCGDTKLFDISFAKTKDGFLIGKYKDTSLYLVTYELKKGKMSEDDFAELNLMQEDYSVVLDHLIEDEDFVLAKN